MSLGEKVEMLRRSLGLKVKDLAQRAGVTPSLLSQIEKGKANPSINSLRAIAQALDVPIVTFFEETPSQSDLVVRWNERKRLRLPNAKVEYELLSPVACRNIEFAIMRLAPQGESVFHPMGHPAEETALVQGGSVEVFTDLGTFQLQDGDSIYIPPNVRHKWVNVSNELVVVVFAVSPPAF